MIAPIYFRHTEIVAEEFVKAGATIIYGGGAAGLMGCLANTALAKGGKVIGILPYFMDKVKLGHNGITEMVLVDDMSARKKLMISSSDAIVALPGGCGTLEELMEAFTLKQLGVYTKPIVVLNTNGFYNHLIEFINSMVAEHFMCKEHSSLWTIVDNPHDVIPALTRIKEVKGIRESEP